MWTVLQNVSVSRTGTMSLRQRCCGMAGKKRHLPSATWIFLQALGFARSRTITAQGRTRGYRDSTHITEHSAPSNELFQIRCEVVAAIVFFYA